jgi:hypothetical protein
VEQSILYLTVGKGNKFPKTDDNVSRHLTTTHFEGA